MRTYYKIIAIKHRAITGKLMEQKRGWETSCIHGNHWWETGYHNSMEESMDVLGDIIGNTASLNEV